MSASGLSSPLVCPDGDATYTDAQLLADVPRSLTTDTIAPNPATKQLPQTAVQSFVISLENSGAILPTPIDPGTGLPNTTLMASQDLDLQERIRSEYCHLEQRYIYALSKFLTLATSTVTTAAAQAKAMLDICIKLNLKIQCLQAVSNTIVVNRTSSATALQTTISSSTSKISETTTQLNKQYSFLSKDNAVLETQKELIKYSKEKNDQVANQIALFTIMNAFAIGAIFAIVRS